jgi:hypothetical protein
MQVEARRLMIASWAVLGVAAILAKGSVRLAHVAVPRLREGLTAGEWLSLAFVALLLGYVEGYRGFTRSFSPRVVQRAFDLARTASPLEVALAPLYAMSLIGDTRDRLVRAWALVAMIVVMVVAVRMLPHTWRCIVDASVAVSLAWGLVGLCGLWIHRMRRELRARA